MFPTLILLAGAALGGPPSDDGVIEGVVVRTADQAIVPGAEVVLRLKRGDQPLPLMETVADAQGRFRFDGLSSDGTCLYQPGANRDGIHYPGASVRLGPAQCRAEVTLTVCDAVAFPNPLVVRSHTIVLRPEAGMLRVTESMLIDNPTANCYVGRAEAKDAEPITLQLAIPADFERVTFANEFFGRRFAVIGGKLSTGVPWPPGRRELSFSYVLPCAQGCCLWNRPLDLPSTRVRVLPHVTDASDVTCNLDRASPTNPGEVAFETPGRRFDAGYTLQVKLGHLPVSFMTYAPGGAVTALGSLICLTWFRLRSRGHSQGNRVATASNN